MKKQFLYIISYLLTTSILLLSCKKENNDGTSLFYGSWKTSYGDTIIFSKTGDKNILQYDNSLNPVLPATTDHEYTYRNGKLGVKNGLNGPGDFYFFQSFRWIQNGQEFEVQGVQWFPFISSTLTYFTFIKIP